MKIKSFLKNNIKLVVAFIVGGIIFSGAGAVFAASLIPSSRVTYGNTTIDVAIDGLYTKTSGWIDVSSAGEPITYNYGRPNRNSSSIPPEGKNVYLAFYDDAQLGVCINRNGKRHCFRYANWLIESQHLVQVFSDISCNTSANGGNTVLCKATDFSCNVNKNGSVSCSDLLNGGLCYANGGSGYTSNADCG